MKIYNALLIGRWRAVTEQLPDPGTVVLAYFDNGEISSVWQEWKDEEDPFTYKDFPDDGTQTVTHWMPMPPPPVEEIGEKLQSFGSTITMREPTFAQVRTGMQEIEKLIARCIHSSNLDPESVVTKVTPGGIYNDVVLSWYGKERSGKDG